MGYFSPKNSTVFYSPKRPHFWGQNRSFGFRVYDFFAPYTPTRMKLKYSSIVKWILLSCFTFPWKFPKDNFTLRRSVRRKKLVLGVAKQISHWLPVQPLAAINDYLASINFGQRACVSVLRIISRSILKWRNFLNV